MLDPDTAGSYLDAALDEELAASPSFKHEPGELMGHYRLEERLGEGGFGEVWRATQVEPVEREVALKIVRGDMDSAPVIARFRMERRALARMDHPGIARAIEAGSTRSGELYFAMELVRGEPITSFCKTGKLNLKQRVELLIQVCRAVEHAHQKAVLHRDLKPDNILVTEIDGKPTVKIIDFGIAKALTGDAALSRAQALTQAGLVIGTFDYMAPEQAEPGKDGDDIRVDVYALGVILYELITGVTPLQAAIGDSSTATMRAILGAIVTTEPRLPSRELRMRMNAHDTVPSGISCGSVRQLDLVLQKMLAKEARARYSTAGELAADLQNYLEDQPLSVGVPGITTRLVRLASRHRTKFAIGAIGALATTVASVISSVAYVREANARQLADDMRLHAEASERFARMESQRAVSSIDFLAAVLGEAGARVNEGSNADALRAALKKGEELVAKLHGQDFLQASLQGHLANAYEAMEEMGKAIPLRKNQLIEVEKRHGPSSISTLEVMMKLAVDYRDSSNHALALPIFKTIAERYEELGKADTLPWFEALGQCGLALSHLQRHEEALRVLRGLLDRSTGKRFGREDSGFLRRLAMAEAVAGEFEIAEARLQKSLDIGIKTSSSATLEHRRAAILETLARIERMRGKFTEAAQYFDESLTVDSKAFGDSHPTLIDRWIEAARCHAQAKQFDRALEHLAKAESIAVNDGVETQRIHCLRARAELYTAEGRDEEGLAAYQKFLPVLQQSNDARPSLEIGVRGIMITLHSHLNHHAEAVKLAVELWRRLESESAVKDDAVLWEKTLQRLIDAVDAAASADPLLPGIAQRDEWRARLAELKQIKPSSPALPAP